MLHWLAFRPTYRLQSVLNAAARTVAGLRRSDHITDWHLPVFTGCDLRAPERVKFKLAVIVCRAVHGTAPLSLIYCVALLASHQDGISISRSSTSSELVISLTVIGHLLLLAPGSGTLCLRTLHLRRLYWCFDENWRRISFGSLIRHYTVACCARWSL